MKWQAWVPVSLALLTALLLVSGCGGEKGEEAAATDAGVPAEALAKARLAADALTTELKKEWAAAMSEGGPVHAINVCAEVAPEVARTHSVDGVSVRRVAVKARNPNNRPADPWEEAQIQILSGQLQSGEMPKEYYEVVEAEDGSKAFRYLRPIEVGAVCLNCHGDVASIDPEVMEAIQEVYPEDEATGFAAGDLRGVVSVTVPAG